MKTAPHSPTAVSRRDFLNQLVVGAAAVALTRPASAETASATRKLGVALVGLGGYSQGQLGPALRETKFCRLAAVVTGDPAKGARWAREYGFPEKSVYGY